MTQAATQSQEITGILNIRFRKEESGWAVGKIGDNSIVGVLSPDLGDGDYVRATGKWQDNPRFGRQFKVETCFMDMPKGNAAITNYLKANFRWVGTQTADAIVETFGDDFFETLENNSERLTDIRGITSKRAQDMSARWKQIKGAYDVDMFFAELELTGRMVRKLYETYIPTALKESGGKFDKIPVRDKQRVVKLIKENPYRLARDVEGIGFMRADEIAGRMGIEKDDPCRLEAGIRYALEEAAMREGHCHLPQVELLEKAQELLRIDDMIKLNTSVSKLEEEGDIVSVENGGRTLVYLANFKHMEDQVSAKLAMLAGDVDNDVNVEEIETWDILTEEQKHAVRTCVKHRLLVVTGGPGVGKTFTLKSILSALRMAGKNYRLAAPTGKAAKRMQQQTGEHTSTIHRLLGFCPDGTWGHNEHEPLSCDMVVIDETSMVDLALMYRLTNAIDARHTGLIMIGDIDQLPSVGPGQIFRDVIESGMVPVTRLTKIMRQDETSFIVKNAHNVNNGNPLELDNEHSFFVQYHEDADDVAANVIQQIRWLQEEHGLSLQEHIQVLCPMKKAVTGTKALNERISETFNAQGRPVKGTDFRVGDRVIHTVNRYKKMLYRKSEFWHAREQIAEAQEFSDTVTGRFVENGTAGCFNGEIGFIVDYNQQKSRFYVEFDDGMFTCYTVQESYSDLLPAWAMTIHKSQGSEYEAVIIPLHTNSFIMLQRNLLYTAITRAVRYVVLVAKEQAVQISIARTDSKQRYTSLRDMIGQRVLKLQEEREAAVAEAAEAN